MKTDNEKVDDLRPEYDRSDFTTLERGKYVARITEETNSKTQDFPVFYFETCFKLKGDIDALPASYAIITAFATTGETWTEKENRDADAQLAADLDTAQVAKWRMTGYSPTTGHAEPGWATPLSAQAACELGTRYRQHAIYLVDEGILRVMLCDGGQQAVVGRMGERLQVC